MTSAMQLSTTPLSELQSKQLRQGLLKIHTAQIENKLRDLGAVAYDMWLPETRSLPLIIHPNEQIMGIVFGRYKQSSAQFFGRGALVATDQRVLLIDKKPMFVKYEEISYRVVSAVTYSRVGPIGNVTLHTRLGDINLRTFNQRCAYHFVEGIEANILNKNDDQDFDDLGPA